MHVFLLVNEALEVVFLIDNNFSNRSLLPAQEVNDVIKVVLVIFTCCPLLNVGNTFLGNFFLPEMLDVSPHVGVNVIWICFSLCLRRVHVRRSFNRDFTM